MTFFFTNTFYSRHVSFFFFCQFSNLPKVFFLKKTNKTLVFSIFFSSSFIQSKHHPTLGKKQNENYFFVFFSEIKNTFFCFDKSQIFSNFNEVIKFIDTKTGKHFFQPFLIENHNTRASALLITGKRNLRTKMSLRVS